MADLEYNQIAKIKVFGIGGAGSNAVNRMVEDKIKNVELSLSKKEVKETKNEVVINEIEKVEIQVVEKKKDDAKEEKSDLTESEKKEIKKYLSSVYELQEKQITIN